MSKKQKEKISLVDIFYIFLIGCFFGWITEGIWSFLKRGILINHTALVLGPFNIVYGVGAVVLTIFLYRIKDKNIPEVFVISFLLGTILEYIMSFGMEQIMGFVAWNYSKKPFNINGRVCLLYSGFWGILGIIWIKHIYPFLKKQIDKINYQDKLKLMKITIVFLIFNILLTFSAVKRAKEYDLGISPTNKYEEILDKYLGVDYLNNIYNNRWYKKN